MCRTPWPLPHPHPHLAPAPAPRTRTRTRTRVSGVAPAPAPLEWREWATGACGSAWPREPLTDNPSRQARGIKPNTPEPLRAGLLFRVCAFRPPLGLAHCQVRARVQRRPAHADYRHRHGAPARVHQQRVRGAHAVHVPETGHHQPHLQLAFNQQHAPQMIVCLTQHLFHTLPKQGGNHCRPRSLAVAKPVGGSADYGHSRIRLACPPRWSSARPPTPSFTWVGSLVFVVCGARSLTRGGGA